MLNGDQMKKKTKLTWTAPSIKAFEDLRSKILSCPLSSLVSEKATITLRTDASDYGIGGVLFQTINKTDYPIAFVSKTLFDI